MISIEELPLELWQRTLSYLDERFVVEVMPSMPPQVETYTPIKNLSLVCRALRIRTISTLFTHVIIKQYFSERKILKGQDLAFSRFVSFILDSGLQGKKTNITFQMIVDEMKRGPVDGRSANWLADKKDWHIHRQTARLFEILNVERFVLQLVHKWRSQTQLVNVLLLSQEHPYKSSQKVQSDILLLQSPWSSIDLQGLPWNQHSVIHYSLTEFSRRTPSLLKPVEAPLKYPYLEMHPTPFPSRFELPGSLNSLTSFTYRPIDNTRSGGDRDRRTELAPITSFLANNCPNLQHLRVKIFPSPYRDLDIMDYYSRFIRIIVSKPNLETPKTFAALDVPDLRDFVGGSAWCELRLSHELAGWEHIGVGQYQSVISGRPLVQ